MGGTGCCEEGCSFSPRRGREWRRPLCPPLPVVLEEMASPRRGDFRRGFGQVPGSGSLGGGSLGGHLRDGGFIRSWWRGRFGGNVGGGLQKGTGRCRKAGREQVRWVQRGHSCSAGLGPQLSTLARGETVGESVSSSAVGRGPALAARAELTSGLPGAPASLSPQLLLSRLSALPRDGSSAVVSRAWRLNSGQGREATQPVCEAWMVRLGMGQGGPCPLQAASRGPSSQSPL